MRLVTGPAASLSLILCPQCSTSHRSISDTLLHILFLARISPILDLLFSAAVSPAALQPTTCPDLHGFCHTFPRSGLLCQVSICQSFTPEVCIYRLNVLRKIRFNCGKNLFWAKMRVMQRQTQQASTFHCYPRLL